MRERGDCPGWNGNLASSAVSGSRRQIEDAMSIKSINLIYLLLPILLSACAPRDDHVGSRTDTTSLYESNGERIYFTGIGSAGTPIPATGGSTGMGMHRQMHGGGCAVCHGADREGRRLWPQFWVSAPALTATALFDDEHTGDGHGDHNKYDAASLRRAITRGLDPSGKPLDSAMPRWQMSANDIEDLVAFLQQSHTHD